MKRIVLTTAYLTVLSVVTLAQLPSPELLSGRKSIVIVPDTSAKIRSVSDEYAPLNNQPLFPGGSQAIQAYFQNLALYPNRAQMSSLRGQVGVSFRIMPTGQLTEFRVVHSHSPTLDRVALDAVALMPPWYPAHRAGVAVSSLYQLLITFDVD